MYSHQQVILNQNKLLLLILKKASRAQERNVNAQREPIATKISD